MSPLNLRTSSHTFDQLTNKYRNFIAPAFEVIIEGTNVLKENIAITSVKVESSVEEKADSFTFTIANAFDFIAREFKWTKQYFSISKTIEIKMGYTDRLESVFQGLITSVSHDYPKDGNPTLTVKGMDMSFLMMRGKNSLTWTDKKHSDVIKEIGRKYVSKLQVDDTKLQMSIISQNAMEDFHFINKLANELNYDFFIIGNTLYFRKPFSSTTPVVTLQWGKYLHKFTVDLNLAAQVSKVIVRGWDDMKQQIVEATANSIKKLGTNSKTGMDMIKILGKNTVEHIQANVSSKQEAQERADAILTKRSMQLITGSGECIGIPEMQAGRYIKLEHVGKTLSQPYYLKSVTHSISKSGYTTSFTVGGNAI